MRRLLFRPDAPGGAAVAEPPAAGEVAAADTAAADAAAAAATAASAAADQATRDAAATAAKTAVPDKYDLKLPETSTFDPTAIERTATFAKERGLSNDAAQAALDLVQQEVTNATTALLANHSAGDPEKQIPPGAEWVKQQDVWKKAALADPELGAGKPEQLEARTAIAVRAFEKFATPDFRKATRLSGFGSHPEFVKVFAKIGEAMSEGSLAVPGSGGGGDSEQAKLDRQYPSMAKK